MNPPPHASEHMQGQIDRLLLSGEARKIIEIVKNDRAPVKSLTEVISAEPVFAARLIRLANFAPGLAQRLSTVPQMVNAFGLDNLKPLSLGLSAFALGAALPRRAPARDGGGMVLRDLWEHALGSAIVAGRFAARVGKVSPIVAFTAGFVHDMGKVFLCRYSLEKYAEAVKVAREKKIPSTEAETLTLGMDHVQAGVAWARKAELPAALENLLRRHHEGAASLMSSAGDEFSILSAVVQAADWACEQEAIGDAGDGSAMTRNPCEAAGLGLEDWRDHVRAVKDDVAALREFYGFPRHDLEQPSSTNRSRQPVEERAASQSSASANGPRGVVIPFPVRGGEAAMNSARTIPGKLAILVVEDHSSLCDLLSLYFMRHGYHVRTASDGESALEVLSREQVHLILLDLMLPRVDGFEVLRQIHRTGNEKTPYIIVVSAGASERDRQKVLDLGANEYMPKPFHLLRLLERVQTVEKFLL